MIRVCIFVLFAAAMVSGEAKKPHYDIDDAPAIFEKYVKEYNKVYKDEADRAVHYKAFVESLKSINELNSTSESAVFDLNNFSDWTDEEKKILHGLNTKKPSST